jgi:predicted nucleic acid-binding protein
MEHFRKTFAGTWSIEPDQSAIRIVPLTGDTVQIYAPTRVTLGAAGQPPKTATFLINEFAIRTQEGWKISAVIAVPAE